MKCQFFKQVSTGGGLTGWSTGEEMSGGDLGIYML